MHSDADSPNLPSDRATAVTVVHPPLTPQQRSPLPWWRLAVPLGIQLLIVLGIPTQNALILATGTTVFLQSAPVDPYDLLRGRYVILNYEVGEMERLKTLPGWQSRYEQGGSLYLTLEADPQSSLTPPTWKAVAVSDQYPDVVSSDQVILKGVGDPYGWRVDFGLGAYYIPEAVGDQLEEDMRDYPQATRMEVKVDGGGNAALVSIWVEDRTY
ncbi:MAG: GDYXXLXY domain-containing protein [Cyanobacteriota bacterium]|nr:GDYXXLXY domain-containing protein [Cyanobacteriota bacterium]